MKCQSLSSGALVETEEIARECSNNRSQVGRVVPGNEVGKEDAKMAGS